MASANPFLRRRLRVLADLLHIAHLQRRGVLSNGHRLDVLANRLQQGGNGVEAVRHIRFQRSGSLSTMNASERTSARTCQSVAWSSKFKICWTDSGSTIVLPACVVGVVQSGMLLFSPLIVDGYQRAQTLTYEVGHKRGHRQIPKRSLPFLTEG